MRILIIHQYFLRDDEPGGSRFNEFAKFWLDQGHEVVVIAGQVSYATGLRPSEYKGKWLHVEDQGGVKVIRTYTPASYSRGILGRMWAFFAFMLSSSSAVLGPSGRPDVILATSPPLTIAVPGWLGAKRWGVPLVFEVRDLWPESAVTTGVLRPDALLTRLLYSLERFIYKRADRLNVLTPAFRQNILDRALAPKDKISFIPNGADLDLFSPGPRDNHIRRMFGWGDRFVVMYAGAHGLANVVGQLVATAELLKNREDILIVTVGDGPERQALQEEIAERGLTNIQMLGHFPKKDMADLVRACDVGTAVLKKIDTFKTVYPNKIFDYMACAKPVLLAIDGVARQLVVDEAKAGIYAEPENPRALHEAIVQLADDRELCEQLADNGLHYVRANFARSRLADKYLDLLKGLVSVRQVPAQTPREDFHPSTGQHIL